MYYHFYHGNLHIGTAHGDEDAKTMLAQLNSEWRINHDNFWSDDGGVEMSKHRTAPRHNDARSMQRWRTSHPGW